MKPSRDGSLDLLLEQYKDRQADVIADFYFNISGMSEAASLRGHLLPYSIVIRGAGPTGQGLAWHASHWIGSSHATVRVP
jgi:hypothetical protein